MPGHEYPLSPLAPDAPPELHPVPGFRLGTAASNGKYKNRDDLMLLCADGGGEVIAAGVLTKSKTASAPVEWCRTVLAGGCAHAILATAGNANAFTGRAGRDSVAACASALATAIGGAAEHILVASTGVIGEVLDPAPIIEAIPRLVENLAPDNWMAGAEAIRTTDTYAKAASRRIILDDGTAIHITGIAKGSGMIAPDMATMLAFIATDAAIGAETLAAMTRKAADGSFNCITVDGDTSTSDSVLVLANGRAGNMPIGDDGEDAAAFASALFAVMRDLALLIIRDGEGAKKLITVNIAGAENDTAARIIGLAVAGSPLVKTAVAGEDANWGRVVMAVGKSGEMADRDRLTITIGGVMVAKDGMAVAGYDETPVAEHMEGQEIVIDIDVGIGRGAATVWGCDLTADYIAINADYRS